MTAIVCQFLWSGTVSDEDKNRPEGPQYMLKVSQEYPTEPLLRLSAPRAEILLAGNLNRELKYWLGIYPKRFSYCDFCLNVVPGWKQQLSLPL